MRFRLQIKLGAVLCFDSVRHKVNVQAQASDAQKFARALRKTQYGNGMTSARILCKITY